MAKGEIRLDSAEKCHLLCQACVWKEAEANEMLEAAVATATVKGNEACQESCHRQKDRSQAHKNERSKENRTRVRTRVLLILARYIY